MKRIALAWAFLALAAPAWSQPAIAPADNPQMSAIFTANQAARKNTGATIDWTIVGPQDEKRRAQTKDLLDSGALRTASDFCHAAMVFQHGNDASDYLLAHTLAVIAAAHGKAAGAWMAAATLDRYLQAVGHSQIYGTQFRMPSGQDMTQEPYDRTLISDPLRQALGVPTQADQESRRREMARYRAPPRK